MSRQFFNMINLSISEIDEVRQDGLRPQVVGCFLNNKKVLFVYKEEHDLWQIPQGGIDNNEEIEQAFSREMSEELGSLFVKGADVSELILLGEDQVIFPEAKQGTRELSTDAGDSVFMIGKKYYFVAKGTKSKEVAIDRTEFDDSKWVSYGEGALLAETIYQKGKQRITLAALNFLKEKNLIV